MFFVSSDAILTTNPVQDIDIFVYFLLIYDNKLLFTTGMKEAITAIQDY